MNKSGIAVIVTTYNRPKALCWVLAGLAQQTCRPDSIVVADDGSQASTRQLIDLIKIRWQERGGMPNLIHVWQRDEGFRAGQIRNKAVAQCLSQKNQSPHHLIFLDGDCIPLPNFVAEHSKLIGKPSQQLSVAGGRTLISKELTLKLEEESEGEIFSKYDKLISTPQLIKWRVRGGLNRILPLITLPDSFLRLSYARKWQSFRTCNVSIWTANFVNVNGFNENFVGWGFEDSDLAIRLIRTGIKIKNGRFATNVLHLWHPEFSRSNAETNKALLENSWSSDIKASRGLDEHTESASWG